MLAAYCARFGIVRTLDRNTLMGEFEFSLIASGPDSEADGFEDIFFKAGCDDATISVQRGIIILDFVRVGLTFEQALWSAIVAVRRVGATVRGVEPSDVVSLSEIARRAKMSRAAISNYFGGTRRRMFPAPIDGLITDSPVWSWAEVARWLHEQERLEADQVHIAGIIAATNIELRPPADAHFKALVEEIEADVQKVAA